MIRSSQAKRHELLRNARVWAEAFGLEISPGDTDYQLRNKILVSMGLEPSKTWWQRLVEWARSVLRGPTRGAP